MGLTVMVLVTIRIQNWDCNSRKKYIAFSSISNLIVTYVPLKILNKFCKNCFPWFFQCIRDYLQIGCSISQFPLCFFFTIFSAKLGVL